MNITEEGLALIREAEGFRSAAYRDAVGVWTIGYGHTAAAGAPKVERGLVITRDEAEAIFRRDVEAVAEGVRQAVRQTLSDASSRHWCPLPTMSASATSGHHRCCGRSMPVIWQLCRSVCSFG